jgi:hypothetical protein
MKLSLIEKRYGIESKGGVRWTGPSDFMVLGLKVDIELAMKSTPLVWSRLRAA